MKGPINTLELKNNGGWNVWNRYYKIGRVVTCIPYLIFELKILSSNILRLRLFILFFILHSKKNLLFKADIFLALYSAFWPSGSIMCSFFWHVVSYFLAIWIRLNVSARFFLHTWTAFIFAWKKIKFNNNKHFGNFELILFRMEDLVKQYKNKIGMFLKIIFL